MAELGIKITADYREVMNAKREVEAFKRYIDGLDLNITPNIDVDKIRTQVNLLSNNLTTLMSNLQKTFAQAATSLDYLSTHVKDVRGVMNGVASGSNEASSSLGNATQEARNFGGVMNDIKAPINEVTESIKRYAMQFTVGAMTYKALTSAVSTFQSSIATIQNYSAANSTLGAILGLDANQLDTFTESSERLGRSTVFTASQVTQLQTELSKLGFQANDIHALEGAVLGFAQAAGASLPDAAGFAGAAMRMFQVPMEEAGRVTGATSAAIMSTALDFRTIQENFAQFGPVAHQVGLSVEEALTAFGVLKNQGYDGSMAATSLRNILNEMAGGKISKKLGYQVDSFEKFKQALIDLGEGGMQGAKGVKEAMDAVGKRGGAQLLALVQEMKSGKIDNTEERIKEGASQETTDAMASRMTNNLAGSLKMMQSAWEGFILTFRNADGIMKDVVDGVTEGIGSMRELIAGSSDLTRTEIENIISSIELLLAAFASIKGGIYLQSIAEGMQNVAVETAMASDDIIKNLSAEAQQELELSRTAQIMKDAEISAVQKKIKAVDENISIIDDEILAQKENLVAAAELKDEILLEAEAQKLKTLEDQRATLMTEKNTLAEEVNTLEREKNQSVTLQSTAVKKAEAIANWNNAKAELQETIAKIANTTATNAGSAASLKDILAKGGQSIATAAYTMATWAATAATSALNVAMLACPYIAITAAVIGLGYALYKLVTYTDEADRMQEKLDDTMKESDLQMTKTISDNQSKYASLKAMTGTAAAETEFYRSTVLELAEAMQKQGLSIDETALKEGNLVELMKEINEHYDEYIHNIEREEMAKARAKGISAIIEQQNAEISEAQRVFEDFGADQEKEGIIGGRAIAVGARNIISDIEWDDAIKNLDDDAIRERMRKRFEGYIKEQGINDDDIIEDFVTEFENVINKQIAARKARMETLKALEEGMDFQERSSIYSKNLDEASRKAAEAQALQKKGAEGIKKELERISDICKNKYKFDIKLHFEEDDVYGTPEKLVKELTKGNVVEINDKREKVKEYKYFNSDGEFSTQKAKELAINKAQKKASEYTVAADHAQKDGKSGKEVQKLVAMAEQYANAAKYFETIDVAVSEKTGKTTKSIKELFDSVKSNREAVSEYEKSAEGQERIAQEAKKASEKTKENHKEATNAIKEGQKASSEGIKETSETANNAIADNAEKTGIFIVDNAQEATDGVVDSANAAGDAIDENGKKAEKVADGVKKKTDKTNKSLDNLGKERPINVDDSKLDWIAKKLKWIKELWDEVFGKDEENKPSTNTPQANTPKKNTNKNAQDNSKWGQPASLPNAIEPKKPTQTPTRPVPLDQPEPKEEKPKSLAQQRKDAKAQNQKDKQYGDYVNSKKELSESEKLLIENAKKFNSLDEDAQFDMEQRIKELKKGTDEDKKFAKKLQDLVKNAKKSGKSKGTNPEEDARKKAEREKKATEEVEKARTEDMRKMYDAYEQAEIDAMVGAQEKIAAVREQQHRKELEEIDRQGEEREKRYIDQARKLFEADPANIAKKGGVGNSFDEDAFKQGKLDPKYGDFETFKKENDTLVKQQKEALDVRQKMSETGAYKTENEKTIEKVAQLYEDIAQIDSYITAETNKGADANTELIALLQQRKKVAQSILETERKASFASMYAYLKEYGTVEERRLAITEEYAEKIRQARERGDMYEVASLQEQQKEALGKINFEEIKENLNWEDLFNNLGQHSSKYLEKTREELANLLNDPNLTIEERKEIALKINDIDTTLDDKSFFGTWSETFAKHKRAVAEAEQAMERYNNAVIEEKMSLADLNTVKERTIPQLVEDLKNVGVDASEEQLSDSEERKKILENLSPDTKGYEKIKKQIEDIGVAETKHNKKKAAADKAEKEKEDAEDKKGLDFKELARGISEVFNRIASEVESLGGIMDELGFGDTKAGALVKQGAAVAGSVAGAAADIASGNYVGAALKGIQAVKGVSAMIEGGNKAESEREIEKLRTSMDVLRKSIDGLSEKMSKSTTSIAEVYGTYEMALKNQGAMDAQYRRMMGMVAGEWESGSHSLNYNFGDNHGGTLSKLRSFFDTEHGLGGILENTTAEEWKRLRTENAALYAEMIQAINDETNDHTGQGLGQLIDTYIDEYADAKDRLRQSFNESILSFSLDSIQSEFRSFVQDISTQFADVSKNINQHLQEAISNALMKNKYNKLISDLYDQLAKDTASGDELTTQEASNFAEQYKALYVEANEEIKGIYDKLGLGGSSTEAQGTVNAARSITEDTGNELVGRITAVQMALEQILTYHKSGNIEALLTLIASKDMNEEALTAIVEMAGQAYLQTEGITALNTSMQLAIDTIKYEFGAMLEMLGMQAVPTEYAVSQNAMTSEFDAMIDRELDGVSLFTEEFNKVSERIIGMMSEHYAVATDARDILAKTYVETVAIRENTDTMTRVQKGMADDINDMRNDIRNKL